MNETIYPDGLFEFDTSDRSAETGPPALLRLRLADRHELAQLLSKLAEAIVSGDEAICIPFSGKLTEVEE